MTVVAESPVPAVEPAPELEPAGEAKPRDILIICYSGELEKTWATMILATTGAAMGAKVRVFLTFWGLQTFVKVNVLGMGPWMMGKLAKQYKVASPKELLEIAQAMGVEFMPCQMTMDMFGLKKEDMIDGLGDPVGAATVISLMQGGDAPLFI
jgi:peroxiredoxin family protein